MLPAPNPDLQIDSNQCGPRSFFELDATDPRFHIEASLRVVGNENVLSFIVVAELFDGSRGRVRGSQFFTAMMDHFGNDAVDVIEGQWEDLNPAWVTNLKVFNKVLGTTSVTLPDAATRTPTGIYATRRGYTDVSVVRAEPKWARGNYAAVLVEFRLA